MRNFVFVALLCVAMPVCVFAQAGMQSDQIPRNFTLNANPHTLHAGSNAAGGGKLGNRSNNSLLGIDSVMCPIELRKAAWSRLASDLDRRKLAEITHEIGLDEVVAAGSKVLAGEVRGRIVVKIV